MNFIYSILFGVLKQAAEWALNKVFGLIEYYQSLKKHNAEIDDLVEKQKLAATAAKENPTDENKKKLIDAARDLIRKSDGL
jgi:hypothetical protein